MEKKKNRQPVRDQELLRTWLPLAMVMDSLGASERTVNRMVERGKLQQGYLNIPGRRPAAVFNPADVEAMKAEQESAKTFLVPATQSTALARHSSAMRNDGALADLIPAIAQAISSAQPAATVQPAYVELEAAARISGLPKRYLLGLAKANEIKARKIGRWYFQRHALEQM